jgi:hypothetical protein
VRLMQSHVSTGRAKSRRKYKGMSSRHRAECSDRYRGNVGHEEHRFVILCTQRDASARSRIKVAGSRCTAARYGAIRTRGRPDCPDRVKPGCCPGRNLDRLAPRSGRSGTGISSQRLSVSCFRSRPRRTPLAKPTMITSTSHDARITQTPDSNVVPWIERSDHVGVRCEKDGNGDPVSLEGSASHSRQ